MIDIHSKYQEFLDYQLHTHTFIQMQQNAGNKYFCAVKGFIIYCHSKACECTTIMDIKHTGIILNSLYGKISYDIFFSEFNLCLSMHRLMVGRTYENENMPLYK